MFSGCKDRVYFNNFQIFIDFFQKLNVQTEPPPLNLAIAPITRARPQR